MGLKTAIIIIGILMILGFCLVKFIFQPIMRKKPMAWKTWLTGMGAGVALLVISGAFFYAEPGRSYLAQYPWGTQVSHLDPGYHFHWYGTIIDLPKVIGVRLTDEGDTESETATETDNSVLVRFSDSVRANVSSSTRFRLPEDPELFRKVAVDYRSLANLVQSTMVPVTKEVIRNSARELSAQDYVTGQGGQFEANVLDQLENGIVVLELKDELVPIVKMRETKEEKATVAAVVPTSIEEEPAEPCEGDNCPIAVVSTDEELEPIAQLDNDRGVKTRSRVHQRVVRVRLPDGTLQRKAHPLVQYGIKVIQSTIERVLPEKKFQEMLGKQRDAAAKAAVSRQEAKQAEYERQKVIANGETEKARIKMEQEMEQVQKITAAETVKKQAEVDLETSQINKQRARIDADALLITKKAQAEGKRVVMVADGALEQKLSALVEINQAWAEAAGQHAMVPSVMVGGDGKGNSNSSELGVILQAMAAKQLGVDVSVRK